MIILLVTLLLLSNALSSNKAKSILYTRTVILYLACIICLEVNTLYVKPLVNGIGIYGGLFNLTLMVKSITIFIYFITFMILTLNSFYPRKEFSNSTLILSKINWTKKINYKEIITSARNNKQFNIIEYGLIIVFVITGAVFLMSTADLISVFLAIELQSYGLYILSTLYRDSEVSTNSGLTYFLLGGLSSCFILLGSALLYINSGTTSLDNINIINSICDIKESIHADNTYEGSYIQLSMIIMVTGFLFKISAAPFHFWSPDVYDGIPTVVTTFVAIVAKISIFIFLFNLVCYTECFNIDFSWKTILLISSILSLIIGSVLGLTQTRIKRLFAYSTISHVGFILLSLSITTTESIQAYLFYIIQYSLANLNGFIIIITIGYTLYTYSYNDKGNKEKLIDQNNSPIQLVSQIKGYFYINPYLALSLSVCLFSFVGIPPLTGFFAKQMVLSAALDKGYVFISLVAIITSVIGAGYYLNMVKNIFFVESEYNKNKPTLLEARIVEKNENKGHEPGMLSFNANNVSVNSGLSSIISMLTILLSVFVLTPTELLNIITMLSMY